MTINPVQTKEIVGAIKGIKIPDVPEKIRVTNLNEVVGEFGKLQKSIQAYIDKVESVKEVKGDVRVVNFPPIDLSRIESAISKLSQPTDKKQKPQVMDFSPIVDAIEALEKNLTKVKSLEFPEHISVDNFPPQLTPQPVTNININSLRGIAHTTQAIVTTSLTPLPTYGVLQNRRSMILFNNSSSTTIFIGGSDVTSVNGLPIPAQTYSPPIDAGPLMVIYGITASGSADVRVMEVSTDATGS